MTEVHQAWQNWNKKIIAEKMLDECLHPGSNLQLAPPCVHCSNALIPTELPPLLRSYLSHFVNYHKQIKYCRNSIEIFPFWFLMIMIMMSCSFKSQHEIKAWSPYSQKDRKHVLATMSQRAYHSSPGVDCKNLLWEIAIIKSIHYHVKKLRLNHSCYPHWESGPWIVV